MVSATILAGYIWLPNWATIIGMLLGFINILKMFRVSSNNGSLGELFMLLSFIVIGVCDYLLRMVVCNFQSHLQLCQHIGLNSLIVLHFFFIGGPVAVIVIFVSLPKAIRKLSRK
jgi:hypothetical protein